MSLLVHRRAIERAVLGDLAAPAEARLRAHLGGCAHCRAHYDRLARTAEALGGGRAAAGRARDRLFAALDGPALIATPDPAAQRPIVHRRRAWLGAALALVPAAALVMLW
ncbi:MAG TPA: hypothetical protein VFF36_09080, partial [Planctomycetota bacterium]|nr:hypothetical protein [Planctomycetota bacterium]